MAITFDFVKKAMITAADEFFARWGYCPSRKELKIATENHPVYREHEKTKLSNKAFDYDFGYLVSIGMLEYHKMGGVYATPSAVKSISELDDFDA